MAVTASVPGRIFVGGDHATLLGGPRIASALDLRLRVTVSERDDDTVLVRGPLGRRDTTLDSLFDSADSNAVLTVSKSGRSLPVYTLLRRILSAVGRTGPDELPGFSVEIDVDEAFPMGVGLGSSTATTVALTAALTETFGETRPDAELVDLVATIEDELYADAVPIDPAVIVSGGLVFGESTISERATNELPVLVATTETRPSRTEIRRQVERRRSIAGPRYDEVRTTSDATTEQLWARITNGDHAEMRELITFYGELLDALGFASWPLPELRAADLVQQRHDLGVKQSDFGRRAALVTFPDERSDAAELERVLGRTAQHVVSTTTTTRGLEYDA
jgi:mevalonate kinase